MTVDQPIVLELDSRGRMSLGKILGGKRAFRYYLAEVDTDDGTITLRPAVFVPKSQVEGS